MRPLNLKLSAFGSFVKPVEIDFEKGLEDAKIFLIHGPTGAGKTTLLDAICYALYEESSGGTLDGGRDKKTFRSEFAEDNQEMSVEFTFAMNNSIYRIKRVPPLKKGAKKIVELYKDNNLLASEGKDANLYIKNLLGFDAAQFRQVVILPQGKFREFLTATSQKREELLSVIFNAEFYAAVEAGLKEKSKNAKAELDKLETLQQNYLSDLAELGEENFDELLKNFSEQAEELKKAVAENKIAADSARKQLTAGELLNREFLQAEASQKKLAAAKENLKSVTEKLTSAQVEFDKRKAEEVTRQDLVKKIGDLQKISDAVKDFQKKSAELEKTLEIEKQAKEKISREEILLKKYDTRVEELEKEIESLQGAEGKFNDAEQKLKLSQEKETRLKDIADLKKSLSEKQATLQNAEKNSDDADKKLKYLQHLQRAGAAAFLAKNLSDGEPCPVCGSIHHPDLAKSATSIPTDEEIELAERFLKRKNLEKDSAVKALSAVDEKIKTYQAELEKLADVLNLQDAKKIFDAAKGNFDKLVKDRKSLQKGKTDTQQKREEFEQLKKDSEIKSKTAENLRGVVETIQKQIPQDYLTNPAKLSEDLRENKNLIETLSKAWQKADEIYHKLVNQKAEQEGAIKVETKNFNELSEKISGKEKPNLSTLQQNAKSAQELFEKSFSDMTQCNEKFNRLKEMQNKITEIAKKVEAAKKVFELWKYLFDVASGEMSSAKISFRRSYLQSIFRDIVEESNARLDKMSEGRYKFVISEEPVNKHVKSGGLDIKIFDAYTGKARVASTLSGGESFLAALSLALGLAAVVKNISGGVKLDTLFIDEGFGSLDSEALDAAIEVLENLQAGGRLVGIISHVDELKQRLHARLEIKKSRRGSFAEFVK